MQELEFSLELETKIILEKSCNYKFCGVYFLINKQKIVYIGQTKIGLPRIFQHRQTKVFDKYSILKCTEKELNFYEDYLIKKFKPKYNKN